MLPGWLPSLPSFPRPHRFSSRLGNNTVEIEEVAVVEAEVDDNDDDNDGTLGSSTKMRPTTTSRKVKNRKATERMNFSINRCSLFCTFSIAALIFICILMFMPKGLIFVVNELHFENTVAKGKDACLFIRKIPPSYDGPKGLYNNHRLPFLKMVWLNGIFHLCFYFIFPSQRTYGMCFCMYRRFGFLFLVVGVAC